MSNDLKAFTEKTDEILKVFEDDKKAKEAKLNQLEESNSNYFDKMTHTSLSS